MIFLTFHYLLPDDLLTISQSSSGVGNSDTPWSLPSRKRKYLGFKITLSPPGWRGLSVLGRLLWEAAFWSHRSFFGKCRNSPHSIPEQSPSFSKREPGQQWAHGPRAGKSCPRHKQGSPGWTPLFCPGAVITITDNILCWVFYNYFILFFIYFYSLII